MAELKRLFSSWCILEMVENVPNFFKPGHKFYSRTASLIRPKSNVPFLCVFVCVRQRENVSVRARASVRVCVGTSILFAHMNTCHSVVYPKKGRIPAMTSLIR